MLVFLLIASALTVVLSQCPVPMKETISMKNFIESDTLKINFVLRVAECDDGNYKMDYSTCLFNYIPCSMPHPERVRMGYSFYGYVTAIWSLQRPKQELIPESWSVIEIWANNDAEILRDRLGQNLSVEVIQGMVKQMTSLDEDYIMELEDKQGNTKTLEEFRQLKPLLSL